MAEKKKYKDIDVPKGLILGGIGLSAGSAAVGALPSSAAQAGVQTGLGVAGGFFPVMATVGAAGIVMKQVKKLKEVGKEKTEKKRRFII